MNTIEYKGYTIELEDGWYTVYYKNHYVHEEESIEGAKRWVNQNPVLQFLRDHPWLT